MPTAEVAVYFAEQCGLDLLIFRTVNAIIKDYVKRQELLMNRLSCPALQASLFRVKVQCSLPVEISADKAKLL